MARPRLADRGDGLQIWRVVANMLNKQRGQPTVVGLQAWVVRQRAYNPLRIRNYTCCELFEHASEMDGLSGKT
jgi:predicted phosphatase